jgi:hypothetical protein
MNKREIVVNLKSIRMTVTNKEYSKLMECDGDATNKLGWNILKKIGKVGMGYMVESIEDAE